MADTKQNALFITALLLAKGKIIDKFSTLITITLLIITFYMVQIDNKTLIIISLIVFLMGLTEKYYAIRIQLDTELFSFLANNPQQLSENLQQLDNTLINLGLLKKVNPTRTLADRQQGAIKLLKKQIGCVFIQVIGILLIVGYFLIK